MRVVCMRVVQDSLEGLMRVLSSLVISPMLREGLIGPLKDFLSV